MFNFYMQNEPPDPEPNSMHQEIWDLHRKVEGRDMEIGQLRGKLAELQAALRNLLTVSLPVDVSGQRFIDAAREALELPATPEENHR